MKTKIKIFRRSAQRGGVLITTLVMATVIASMLAGLGTLLVSSYSRAMNDSNYANAIDLADAGINYEIRRITSSSANADMPGTTTPPGNTVTFGNGSFVVCCTMTDGHTAWDGKATPFDIVSTGISGSTSRQVVCTSTGTYSQGLPNFGIFGTSSVQVDSAAATISKGDIGCNGSISCSGSCPNGKCWLAGPSASQSNFTGSCVSLPNACAYPSCSQCATTAFPNSGATAPGGLSYLQNHNDNSKCGLSTYNCNITSSCTLTGPCNVYVNSIYLSGNQTITCNNTNGPCNIWVSPGSGCCHFQDNSCVSCTSSDPTKACTVYCANSGNVFNGSCSCDMHDSCSLQCNIYSCNGNTGTYGAGCVQCHGTPTMGCCICDSCHVYNAATCTAATPSAVPAPIPANGYGFGSNWLEKGGM